METLFQILGLLGAGLIVWFIYRTIKNKPNQFSRENMGKSAMTMGILALGLILFVALLIFIVRAT